jgi:hypothetical protein
MWLQFSTDHSNNNKGFRANYSTIDIGKFILDTFKLILQKYLICVLNLSMWWYSKRSIWYHPII